MICNARSGIFLYSHHPQKMKTLLLIILIVLLVGCKAHNSKEPTNKDESTVAGGFAKARISYQRYKADSAIMAKDKLTRTQTTHKESMDTSANQMNEGTEEAEAGVKPIIEENQKNEQGFFKQLNRNSILGSFVFAIGLSVGLFAPKEPPLIRIAGYVIAGFGIILVGMMWFLKGSDPIQPIIVGSLLVVGAVSVAYLIIVRIIWWHKHQAQDRQMGEIAKTAGVALEAVPPEARPTVLRRIKEDIQNDDTRQVVRKLAKQDPSIPVVSSESA